jgi:hypothetical protein
MAKTLKDQLLLNLPQELQHQVSPNWKEDWEIECLAEL